MWVNEVRARSHLPPASHGGQVRGTSCGGGARASLPHGLNPFQDLFLWSGCVRHERKGPRTPNPDHKGTNTIGREVREEIGWSEALRVQRGNSFHDTKEWSTVALQLLTRFAPSNYFLFTDFKGERAPQTPLPLSPLMPALITWPLKA